MRLRLVLYAVLLVFVLPLSSPVRAAEELVEGLKPLTDDFEQMLERRFIRVLVVHNPMLFFLDQATQRGIVPDAFAEFEKMLNEKYDLKTRKMHIVFLPVPRDQLIPRLVEGYGDIIAANLTITPERQEQVAFSDPFFSEVKEQLVTGSKAPEVASLDDLAGKTIHTRETSSYFASLTKLNEDLESRDLDPVEIVTVPEYLEDYDLLDMANAGLIDLLIVDSHKAQFWQDIFENITVHEDIFIRDGGQIAWAMRKDNPTLKKIVDQFVKDHKKGTMMGNILFKRYLKENEWVRNSADEGELEKFEIMVEYFEKYAAEYDFDYLMLAALGYQESRLDQSVRSPAGAVGVMQLLPTTAEDKNVGIPNIEELEPNIHAGAKYLRFVRDRYFSDPEIDDVNQTLLTFASYNAGPARVAKLREEAKQSGLDPNLWFGNVEIISAKRIGRETTNYVSNIVKYYLAYRLLEDKEAEKQQAMEEVSDG